MRVLLLTNLPRAYGGLEIFTSYLTCELGCEFEFVIAGCAADGEEHRFLLPHKARIRHIATRWHTPSTGRLARARDVWFALRQLDACIRAEQPDLILLQATDPWHPLLSLLVLLGRLPARIVFAFHIPHAIIFARMRPLSRWVVRQGMLRAERVLGVSRGLVVDVSREFRVPAEKCEVFYNPVPVSEIAKRARELPVSMPDRPSIVHIARIDPLQKNQKLLLSAISLVLKQRDVQLDILGSGEPDEELRTLLSGPELSSRVKLHGFQSDVVPWLKRASMLVLSSNYEGFAYVLIEALAAGCPVVSTDCPHGPRELLGADEYGLLTPPGDADALASAMLRLLNDEALRTQFATKAQARAHEFSLEAGLARYRRLFRAFAVAAPDASASTNASRKGSASSDGIFASVARAASAVMAGSIQPIIKRASAGVVLCTARTANVASTSAGTAARINGSRTSSSSRMCSR